MKRHDYVSGHFIADGRSGCGKQLGTKTHGGSYEYCELPKEHEMHRSRITELEARLDEEIAKVADYILAIDKAWNERDEARARIAVALSYTNAHVDRCCPNCDHPVRCGWTGVIRRALTENKENSL